jgi:hypothetical protein
LFLTSCSTCYDPHDRAFLDPPHSIWSNYRGPFRGQVLDAETLKPIPGAVVFVTWEVVEWNPFIKGVSHPYDTAEVATDAEGRFFLPKNGTWNPGKNFLMNSEVLILKAGYGNVRIDSWRNLKGLAAYLRGECSHRQRKRCGGWLSPCYEGPEWFSIEYEAALPKFLLKRFSRAEDWEYRSIRYPTGISPEKTGLMIKELNSDAEVRKSAEG